MSKSPKMHEVIALHDLSYTDHNGDPQYRRQSSKPFEIDDDNYKQFLARKAVKPLKDAVADLNTDIEQVREANLRAVQADDFGELDNAEAQIEKEASANRASSNKKGK